MNEQAYTYWPETSEIFEGSYTEKPSIPPIAIVKDGTVHAQEKQLVAASKQLQAGEQANLDVIDRLRYIKLLEITGQAQPFFHLEAAFKTIDLPSLEIDEPIEGVDATLDFAGRLEETSESVYDVANIHLTCAKLKKTAQVELSDSIRSRFDLMAIKMRQIEYAFQYKKNALALEAIQKINHNVTGGSTLAALSPIDAFGTNGVHSANDIIQELSVQATAFLKANLVPMDCVVMSSNNFLKMTRNTFVQNAGPFGMKPESMPAGGVMMLPGMQGVQLVVDTLVPDTHVFCLNKMNGLRHCRGPQLQKSWEDFNRDAMLVSKISYLNYFSVDDLLTDERERIGNRYFSYAMSVTA